MTTNALCTLLVYPQPAANDGLWRSQRLDFKFLATWVDLLIIITFFSYAANIQKPETYIFSTWFLALRGSYICR